MLTTGRGDHWILKSYCKLIKPMKKTSALLQKRLKREGNWNCVPPLFLLSLLGTRRSAIERRSRYVTLPRKQNFWMTTNPNCHLKVTHTVSNFTSLVTCHLSLYSDKCWRNFLGLNPKGLHLSLLVCSPTPQSFHVK